MSESGSGWPQGDQPTFGRYLRQLREAAGRSLRDVQEIAGVSNAYLSQIETGQVRRPSPRVLHGLSKAYEVSYEHLMQRAGYLPPERTANERVAAAGAIGWLPTYRGQPLSAEEEAKILEYLAFLRARKGNSK